jgi:hypothetical protein
MRQGPRSGELGDLDLGDERAGSLAGRVHRQLPLRHEMADQAVVRRIPRGWRGVVGPMRLGSRTELVRRTGQRVQTRSAQHHGRVARDQRGEQEVAHGTGHHDPARGASHGIEGVIRALEPPFANADRSLDQNSLNNITHVRQYPSRWRNPGMMRGRNPSRCGSGSSLDLSKYPTAQIV